MRRTPLRIFVGALTACVTVTVVGLFLYTFLQTGTAPREYRPRLESGGSPDEKPLGALALAELARRCISYDEEERRAALQELRLRRDREWKAVFVAAVEAIGTGSSVHEPLTRVLVEQGPAAIERIAAAVNADESIQMRAPALMVRAAGPDAAPFLASAGRSPSRRVRVLAASAAGLFVEVPETAVPALLPLLVDVEEDVAAAAIRSLEKFAGDAIAHREVIREAANDPRPAVRDAAVTAMYRLNQADATLQAPSLLAQVAATQGSDERVAALRTLARAAPQPTLLPDLSRLLSDNDPRVAAAALDVLISWGAISAQLGPRLLEMLRSPSPPHPEKLIDLLVRSPTLHPQARPLVVPYLASRKPLERRSAVLFMDNTTEIPAEARPALLALLDDTEPYVRAKAVECLARFGHDAEIDAAFQKVADADKNPRLRSIAAGFLATTRPTTRPSTRPGTAPSHP